MAKVTKWTIFIRAFFIALIAANPVRVSSAGSGEEQDWRTASQSNTTQGYHNYLSAHPAGHHVRDALLALQNLGAIQGGIPTRGIPGGASVSTGSLY